MKLKELQSLMQDVEAFDSPIVELEQYPTGVEIAARMLYTVDSVFHDFEGCTVVDLGCGTGRLTVGAALLGSPHVVGMDIDEAALDTCQRNLDQFEGLQVDLIQCNVLSLENSGRLQADTVVMNPPFGTRKKGADVEFLRIGLKIARRAVYSLHKSSTRQHIRRLIAQELRGGSSEVLAQLRYDLPASFAFHKQKSKDIEVDLWRFEVGKSTDRREERVLRT